MCTRQILLQLSYIHSPHPFLLMGQKVWVVTCLRSCCFLRWEMLLFPEWLGAATLHFFTAIRKILIFSSKFYMALNILLFLSASQLCSSRSLLAVGAHRFLLPSAVNLRKTPRSHGIKVTWELASSLLLGVYMSLIYAQ